MLWAAESQESVGYTQAKRIADMQKMAQAMQDIQSGFFYNNVDIVRDGAKTLKETIVHVGPTIEEISNKDIYEQFMQNGEKMTHKIKKKIERRAQEVIDRFENGDAVQALQAYSKIAQQCMKCHVRLRKW
jgi:translation initiation factor 2B subunit (eIF-2B alpha/beta/delta family)